MNQKRVDSRQTIESFLLKAREILTDENFNKDKNFFLKLSRHNYSENNSHTNRSTLIDLGYTKEDVINEINSLTIKNYKETFIDNKIGKVNPFYCFIKTIKNKQVYIKFKISEVMCKQVFCVSFHFTEFYVIESDLPYNN